MALRTMTVNLRLAVQRCYYVDGYKEKKKKAFSLEKPL